MTDVVLEGVSKVFGSLQTIHDVHLSVRRGEFMVFVGPSGCGKSTLLRMIAGLESISSGRLLIDDMDVTQTDPALRQIAMVFQSYALYPHMSVRRNLGFALSMTGVRKDEVEKRVEPVARMLRLDTMMERRPGQLSGGQRQRVAIGRALVRKPRVFLFDEPLSNLDAELRVEMRGELAQLHREIGITTIYVTHDQVEAMTLADRIVVLRAGRIEQVGTPLSLYDDPDNLFVAGFIGSPKINSIAASVGVTATGETAVILPGGAEARVRLLNTAPAAGTRVTLAIRPEHLRPAHEGEVGALTMTVNTWEHLGGVSYAHGQLSDGQRLVFEHRLDRNLSRQARLQLIAPSSYALLFDEAGGRIR